MPKDYFLRLNKINMCQCTKAFKTVMLCVVYFEIYNSWEIFLHSLWYFICGLYFISSLCHKQQQDFFLWEMSNGCNMSLFSLRPTEIIITCWITMMSHYYRDIHFSIYSNYLWFAFHRYSLLLDLFVGVEVMCDIPIK